MTVEEKRGADRIWRLAVKAKLGNVWHLSCYGDEKPAAHCNYNIRLDSASWSKAPGTPAYAGAVCGRCQNIAWHLDRRVPLKIQESPAAQAFNPHEIAAAQALKPSGGRGS